MLDPNSWRYDKATKLRHQISGAARAGGDPAMVAMPTYWRHPYFYWLFEWVRRPYRLRHWTVRVASQCVYLQAFLYQL